MFGVVKVALSARCSVRGTAARCGRLVAPPDALVEAGSLGRAPLKERENALSDDL